jgi:MFS transporter, ACS family, D-galactonate transporter
MNRLLPHSSTDQLVARSRQRQVVGLLMAICFLAHFNRVSMAIAADTRIMAQFGISTTSMGAVYSAFLTAYTLCMIPGGWLIDRLGPRFSLALVSFASAAFVVLTGGVGLMAGSATVALGALIGIRAIMGAVSAPLHPAAARVVSLDVPPAGRSTANGFVTGAALLGVASTYVLFGSLIDWLDWPAAFAIAGVLTATIGALWARTNSNVSDERLGIHAAESMLHPAHDDSSMFRNKNLILLTLSYAAVGYFQYLFFYWIHYYFETVLGVPAEQSRIYAMLPSLAMAAGMPLGGWLSDRIQAAYGPRAGRGRLVAAAMSTSAVLLSLGIYAEQPAWIVAWLSLSLGVLGMAEGPFWVAAVEVGGRRGGLSAAVFNTGGNAGGIAAPILTPWVSDTLGLGWHAGIALGSVVCLVGAALWFWIDEQDSVKVFADETNAQVPL